MSRTKIAPAIVILSLVLAACTTSSEPVTVSDVWTRSAPAAVPNAAFYLTIDGGSTDDTLETVATDACGVAEIHETVTNDGVMSMQPRPDGIDVGSGESVKLEPGGYHVMCMAKTMDFVGGESIEVTLQFKEAGSITTAAEVRSDG